MYQSDVSSDPKCVNADVTMSTMNNCERTINWRIKMKCNLWCIWMWKMSKVVEDCNHLDESLWRIHKWIEFKKMCPGWFELIRSNDYDEWKWSKIACVCKKLSRKWVESKSKWLAWTKQMVDWKIKFEQKHVLHYGCDVGNGLDDEWSADRLKHVLGKQTSCTISLFRNPGTRSGRTWRMAGPVRLLLRNRASTE